MFYFKEIIITLGVLVITNPSWGLEETGNAIMDSKDGNFYSKSRLRRNIQKYSKKKPKSKIKTPVKPYFKSKKTVFSPPKSNQISERKSKTVVKKKKKMPTPSRTNFNPKGKIKKKKKVAIKPALDITDRQVPLARAKADNALNEGPYGFEHPEAIDWTLPQFRCPDCEDTLIIYDPWFAPPPTLHLPIVCSSNLSEFSRSNIIQNYGPNITFIWVPGSLNCTDPEKALLANQKQFSIELSVGQDEKNREIGQESQHDCGKSVSQNMEYLGCSEEEPEYSADEKSRSCFWHFNAYDHWRRQVKFTKWDLPSCQDNSTVGDCCREGPHMLISPTGYAKKLTPYCGPEPPKFDKTDFDKGKARWLVLFNNTYNPAGFLPQVGMEVPTIGYRKSAAFDQLHYGERCLCGLRKSKHPEVDPESKGVGEKISRVLGKVMPVQNKSNKKKIYKRFKKEKRKRQLKKKTVFKKSKQAQKKSSKVHKVSRREAVYKKQKKLPSKQTQKKKNKKIIKAPRIINRQSASQPTDRSSPVWPWMSSIVYSSKHACTGYIVSPKIVVTTTRCFPALYNVRRDDNATILEMNKNLDLVKVIGQDEKNVGSVNPTEHWWEEERSVQEIFLHPSCDSDSAPQFCVLALILTTSFNTMLEDRPRPACLTCQVDSYTSPLLKGLPFLASYGLQPPKTSPKSGTYKAPKPIKRYLSDSCPDKMNLTTSETYCLQQLGEQYRCDVDRVTVGQKKVLGMRDYGGLLLNRVGRQGYKINFQVVGLLWSFSCNSVGPAEYIPTWPSLSWVVDLMVTKDVPCTKLVRKSAWTQNITNGFYNSGRI